MSAQDPRAAALDSIDVSRPDLFRDDTWHPWFARLREESPVHFLGDSANGAFWSVTSHALIKEVDMSHDVFSSETKGIAIVDPQPVADGQIQGQSFITLDEPRHAPQRQAVAPSVAPRNLAELEPLIRERAADILDNLPVGETFNWVAAGLDRTDGTYARDALRLPLRRSPQAHLLVGSDNECPGSHGRRLDRHEPSL